MRENCIQTGCDQTIEAEDTMESNVFVVVNPRDFITSSSGAGCESNVYISK